MLRSILVPLAAMLLTATAMAYPSHPLPPHYPPHPAPQPNPSRSVYCMTQNGRGTSFVATAVGIPSQAWPIACDSAMQMCYRSGDMTDGCRVVSQW